MHIEISEENYLTLRALTQSSETLNDVLTRLIQKNKPVISFGDLSLEQFKEALINSKVAQVCIEYFDRKDRDILIWKAANIKDTSNIKGNIQSNYLRDWKSKRISSVNLDVLDREIVNMEYLKISDYLGITYCEFLTLEPVIHKNDLGDYEHIDFNNQDARLLSKVNKEVLNGTVILNCKFLPRKPSPFAEPFVNPYLKPEKSKDSGIF